MKSKNTYVYEISKRLFDIIGSVLGLILLSPLFIIIVVLLKTDSSGPIIYKGLRSGRYNVAFYIYKFRTMVIGADKGASTTSRNDERVTTIGRFLRRTKLDELPQLVNVLKGEMSFVGPRPELQKYTSQYTGNELLILSVLPGITDYSSIYFSNLNSLIDDKDPNRSFEENILKQKNKLRLHYVETCSFSSDLILIAKTILRLLGSK